MQKKGLKNYRMDEKRNREMRKILPQFGTITPFIVIMKGLKTCLPTNLVYELIVHSNKSGITTSQAL